MKCVLLGALVVVCSCATSLAGPILLATGFGEGNIRLPIVVDTMTFTSPLRMQHLINNSIETLDLFDEEAVSVLRSNTPITVSSRVSSVIDDADFDLFTDTLTNGNEDFLFFFDPIVGLIAGGLEQDFLIFTPGVNTNVDLIGYQILSIERDIVYGLTMVDGVIATDVHVQGVFRFFGTPVPEPGMLVLLAVSTVIGLSWNRHSEHAK